MVTLTPENLSPQSQLSIVNESMAKKLLAEQYKLDPVRQVLAYKKVTNAVGSRCKKVGFFETLDKQNTKDLSPVSVSEDKVEYEGKSSVFILDTLSRLIYNLYGPLI